MLAEHQDVCLIMKWIHSLSDNSFTTIVSDDDGRFHVAVQTQTGTLTDMAALAGSSIVCKFARFARGL
jgi:hypothetical protein